jgi:NADH dehydrogenase/NADH:ubiquinone oxidoreductase subunit G
MTERISLTVDDQIIEAAAGETILKAAQRVGIRIPTLCFHDFCTANALCRICVVEVEGSRVLIPACVSTVSQGMLVKTRSERVMRARRTLLEMLAATMDLSETPDVLCMLQEYQADVQRFPDAEPRLAAPLDDNPMFVRDYAKCVLCWRCVQVCADDAQYTYAINFSKRGYETQISTFFEKPMLETTCVFCGQCVGVCPTGALKPRKQWLLEAGSTPAEIMSLTRFERRRRSQQEPAGGVS